MTDNGQPPPETTKSAHNVMFVNNRPKASEKAMNRAKMAARIKAARPEMATYLNSAGDEIEYEEWVK